MASPIALTLLIAGIVAAAAIGGQPKRRRGRGTLAPAEYDRVENIIIAKNPAAALDLNPGLSFPFISVVGAPGGSPDQWDATLEALADLAEATPGVAYGVADFGLIDTLREKGYLPFDEWTPDDLGFGAMAVVIYRASDGRLDSVEMGLPAGYGYDDTYNALANGLLTEIPAA